MKSKILAIASLGGLLLLGGCEAMNKAEQESYQKELDGIQSKLPPGCTFKQLGVYGSSVINAVFCEKTVSTTSQYSCGKNCRRNVTTTTTTPQ